MLRSQPDKKDIDLETVELLMERTITNQKNIDLEFNDSNELDKIFLFCDVFDKYIIQLFGTQEYIEIKNGDKEEHVYLYEQTKILNYIIDGKIIIRDKKFIDIISVLKIFKYNEENRLKCISTIKSLNPNKILELIDEQYIKLYNKKKNLDKPMVFDINLNDLGIPTLFSYTYLMTFERKKCKISIEESEIFIYYRLSGIDYKIALFIDKPPSKFGVGVSLATKKTIVPLAYAYGEEKQFRDECNCLNHASDLIEYFQSFFDKTRFQAGFKKVPLDWETQYIDKLFRYHGINIFNELNKIYPNYKIEILYNWVDTKKDPNGKSYISLHMN